MVPTATHSTAPARKRVWGEIALNVGAVAGVVCIVVALASLIFGLTPLILRSGSMAPAIQTGALAIAKTVPASEIAVGDVVSAENLLGTSITHRVVQVQHTAGGSTQLVLKGDANNQADPSPYVVSEAKLVLFHVPVLGYVVAWLSSTVAIFLGGVLAGSLLMLAFGPMRRRTKSDSQSETSTGPTPGSSDAAEGPTGAKENSYV